MNNIKTHNQQVREQAIARIDALRAKAADNRLRASLLLNVLIEDAGKFATSNGETNKPTIFSDFNILEMTILSNSLFELVEYYDDQKAELIQKLGALEEQEKLQRSAIPQDFAKIASKAIRQRAEELANPGGDAAHLAFMQKQDAILNSGGAVVSAAVPAEPAVEKPLKINGGLPAPEQLTDMRSGPKVVVPENSLNMLIGKDSPLIKIFAANPWFHEGQGHVTVGTLGFRWYKSIDPLKDREGLSRATLPSGFYGGDSVPEFVVVRLSRCILVWSFKLDFDSMCVYMLELSDAESANHRWFNPTQLTSSYTRRLLDELNDFVKSSKTIS